MGTEWKNIYLILCYFMFSEDENSSLTKTNDVINYQSDDVIINF